MLKKILKTMLAMFLAAAAALAAFWLYQNREPGYARLGAEEIASLVATLRARSLSPKDYVAAAVRGHRVVLIGEPHRASEHYLFVAQALEPARSAGASFLGMELFHVSTQQDIDRLMEGTYFDESLGRLVVLRGFPGFYYEEMLEVLRSAWAARRRGGFRVLALGGAGDEGMAALVAAAAGGGRKGLVFSGMHHAYVRYSQPGPLEVAGLRKRKPGAFRAGTLLAEKHGLDAVFVQLHTPLSKRYWMMIPVFLYRKPFVLPFDGTLDQAFLAYGAAAGFDSSLEGFSGLADTISYYSAGYSALKLPEYCDGYIYLGPLSGYTDAKPLKDLGGRKGELEAIGAGLDAYFSGNPATRERLRKNFAAPALAEAAVRRSGLTPAQMFRRLDLRGLEDLYPAPPAGK